MNLLAPPEFLLQEVILTLRSFAVNTMAHYFLSVALLDLLAAAGERVHDDGSKGKDNGCGVVIVTRSAPYSSIVSPVRADTDPADTNSSIASLHNATNVDMMSYGTTKAATDHLVALLAAKFARWYVRVVGINPGCKH